MFDDDARSLGCLGSGPQQHIIDQEYLSADYGGLFKSTKIRSKTSRSGSPEAWLRRKLVVMKDDLRYDSEEV